MLKDGEDCTDYLGPIFNFNRIIRSVKHPSHVSFELTESSPSPMKLGYIIDRLNSFGNRPFK